MVSPAIPSNGQPEVDPTKNSWGIEELIIAAYFTASGLPVNTVSLLITIKTKNESIGGVHVSDETIRSLRSQKSLYNSDNDAYDLYRVGEYLGYNIKDREGSKAEDMWERLTSIGPHEVDIIKAEGESMVQRECYGKSMNPAQVRKELDDGFHGAKLPDKGKRS